MFSIMIFRFKRDRWSMSIWPYSKVASLSNARTGISVEFYLTPLNICFFARHSSVALTPHRSFGNADDDF